ncbi:hypothetical protein ACOSQ3_005420 [Xanthoceras sorbifolium]
MLRSCIINFEGSWVNHLPLIKFAYNNSYQTSIDMAPYEALYGRKCRTLLCWTELGEDRSEKKGYRVRSRKKKVFLKVSPWKKVLRFGKKGTLSSKFIGPHEIIERVGSVAYRLALPHELEKIHNVFHVSMLRKYRSDPSHRVFIKSLRFIQMTMQGPIFLEVLWMIDFNYSSLFSEGQEYLVISEKKESKDESDAN